MAHTVRKTQLPAIAFDGNTARPQRQLIASTSGLWLAGDLSATVDVAAGGGADGVLNPEQPLTLLPNIRIFDGASDPIFKISGAALRQLSNRRAVQPASGLALAIPGIQAATPIRAHFRVPLCDPWAINPIETALRPRDPKNFYVEAEWPGTDQASLAAALITGGTRATTLTNLRLELMLVHDPVLYLRKKPLFLPRIRSRSIAIPAVQPDFPIEIKSGARIRASLLRSLVAGITTEGVINVLSFVDDTTRYRSGIPARSWHEDEQQSYGGVDDVAGVAMAYFFEDFANYGRLGQVFDPHQGGNPKWELDVTGGATRTIEMVTVELEREAGLTDDSLPEGLDS